MICDVHKCDMEYTGESPFGDDLWYCERCNAEEEAYFENDSIVVQIKSRVHKVGNIFYQSVMFLGDAGYFFEHRVMAHTPKDAE